MDEGAAVIYKMEKSLRASLHTFAMDSIVSPPDEDHGIDLEAVCILGCNDSTIDFMTATLKDLVEQQRVKDSIFRKLQPPVKVKEDNVNDASNFGDAQYVLLCIDTTKEGGYRQGQIDNLCQAYRRARIIKARTCCSVICDSGRQYPSTDTLCSRYPELKLLAQAQRLITVQRQSAVKFKITQNSLTILKDWLELSNDTSIAGAQATTVKPAPEIENVLPYSDIAQVLTREAIRSMPGVGCICRLTLLSFAGAVALFFTAVFLCSMMADTDLQSDLRVSRSILCEYLENHRTGKSEWGMQYDALVLTSLQLHQSGWIFRNIQNQRSVDRMEIGLLASITRSRSIQPGTTTLTPVRLAHYINGLLSTYQNPRDFHQHDLVTSLELYLLQHAPYSSALSVFDHAILVIALCNAGVVMSYRHVQNIVLQQDDHGAFTLGLDEVAMASMALACVHGDSDVSSALNRSLTYLLSRRSEDGSYGNQYTTSLTLQALNVTESLLGVHEYEQTVSWLKDSLRSELILKNLDVTSHLLIALSGKSLLHVSALTGADKSSKGLSSTQSLSTTYHNDLLSSYDITNQQQQQHMYGCHMNMQGVCLPIHGVGQQKRKRSKKTRVTLNRNQFAVSYGLQWQDLLLNNCAVIPKR